MGLAAAIAALHEAGSIRETSARERGPAAQMEHGYSPVDLLDSNRANK